VLWGIGGLTFGLTMRYLGMSLGMAVALGYCAAFGTLVPPLFKGTFAAEVLGTRSGLTVLAGIAICVLGIAVAGMAGMSKERELPAAAKAAAVREFNFRKGLIVATISGVMSSCFAFGLAAGDPLKAIAAAKGTAPLWQGLPVLIVVMAGGFTTNFIWCLILHLRNRSGREYFSATPREPGQSPVPLLRNWIFCALAGVVWYFQFFFYSMGESQMGKYGFSSWTMHMASIIIFSTLWGIALKEWKGTSGRTRGLLGAGLALLIFSTIVVGYGNFLGGSAPAH
jgi:L-rhamnose-H+ transport protein